LTRSELLLPDIEPELRLTLDTFRPAAVAMLTCLGVAISEFGPVNSPLAAKPCRVHTPLFVCVARKARYVGRLVRGPSKVGAVRRYV
jgi:hypothetical protein